LSELWFYCPGYRFENQRIIKRRFVARFTSLVDVLLALGGGPQRAVKLAISVRANFD
jgi:hypothetical protein